MKNRKFLVSMDVTSIYSNTPQNEGIECVCRTYENFYGDNHPPPNIYINLREMLNSLSWLDRAFIDFA